MRGRAWPSNGNISTGQDRVGGGGVMGRHVPPNCRMFNCMASSIFRLTVIWDILALLCMRC